jgi:ABC-2 type transport system ATP-binding protein
VDSSGHDGSSEAATVADAGLPEPVTVDADSDPVEGPAVDVADEPAVATEEASDAVAASAEPVHAETAEDPTPADAAVEEPVVAAPDASGPAKETTEERSIETASADEPAEPGPVEETVESVEPGLTEQTVEPAPAEDGVEGQIVDAPTAEAVEETSPRVRDDARGEGTDVASDDIASVEDPTPADAPVEDATLVDAPVESPTPVEEPLGEDDAPVEASAATTAGAAIGVASVESPTSTDADNATPALTLRNVTKTFGELRAVDGIDLTIPAGSFYGLVGPNGAGKTTTLSIIAGLLRADGGTVSINGVDAAKNARAAKKMIGVLPDRLRTFDRLTGRQLLSYYGALRGLPAALVESRSADLARAFDLVDALARPVSDYSAGMTKKVMLAGAMIHSPRLLVLDEPFEAVDPVSSAVILDILGAYVAHGGTVILSSHGMELVERVCSRVAVIVSGQVLAEGTVDEVRGEASLEQRFLELAGGLGDVEGLEWLHTFSG